MLIRQMNQKNVLFVITNIFLNEGFRFVPYVCNDCHDLMQKAINFNDVAIVSVKGSDYRIHFWYMSKHNAISIMKNSDLNKKSDYNFFLSKYKKK